MKTLFVATAFAGMLALSGVSHAAQLSSPTIYGTLEQHSAECAVINGGTTALPVTVKLVSEFGDTIGPLNCGGIKLEPGEFCSLFTPIDNTAAYACVVTAGSVTALRGGLVFHRRVLDDFDLFGFRAVRYAPLR